MKNVSISLRASDLAKCTYFGLTCDPITLELDWTNVNQCRIEGVLGQFLNVIIAMVALICFLFVIGIDFFALAVPYTAALLSLSFVFADSLKRTFNAFVFLFFVNAFDVGDSVRLNNENCNIDEVTLFTTTAYTGGILLASECFFHPSLYLSQTAIIIDGRKMIFVNSNLLDATLINYTRSKDYAVGFTVHVDLSTPAAVIEEFRTRMANYAKQFPQVLIPTSISFS
jgi:small-conductance mechanosensitive channel